jgi:hypothetical protein
VTRSRRAVAALCATLAALGVGAVSAASAVHEDGGGARLDYHAEGQIIGGNIHVVTERRARRRRHAPMRRSIRATARRPPAGIPTRARWASRPATARIS